MATNAQYLASLVNSSGNIVVPVANAGIVFNNTNTTASPTSTTQNDYEVGNWTPRFDGSGTSGSATYQFQAGYYTKIGDMVYASYDIDAGSTLTGATGQLCIRGLPFTVATNTYTYNPVGGGSVGYFNAFYLINPYTITHYLDQGGNYAYFVYGNAVGSSVQYMTTGNVAINTRVIGVIIYRAQF